MLVLVSAGQAVQQVMAASMSPTGMLSLQGTPAHSVFSLSLLVVCITTPVFLLVGGLLLFLAGATCTSLIIR